MMTLAAYVAEGLDCLESERLNVQDTLIILSARTSFAN